MEQRVKQSFEPLKNKLTEKPILYGRYYVSKFFVQTDASEKDIGVVLGQRKGSEEHPIVFHSLKFTDLERSFSALERIVLR